MQMSKRVRLDFSIGTLVVLAVLALGRDLIANGRPLYCRIGGENLFPGLRTIWRDPALPYGHSVLDSIQRHFLWRTYPYEMAVFAPIAFSPGELPTSPDTTVRQARPGTRHPIGIQPFWHWLGTDAQGYDVAAALVGGARVALLAGSLATCLAFALGVLLGALAGYWGDDRLRLRRGPLLTSLIVFPFALFHADAIQPWLPEKSSEWVRLLAGGGVAAMELGLAIALGRWLCGIPFLGRLIALPVDLIVMRLAEAFLAVPGLLAVVAFAALLREQTQTLWALIALIGLFSWPSVALYVRAEMLRVREMDYIAAARSLGLSEKRIFLRHALPNALQPAYTVFALGVASAILLEASLSFLGYGDQRFSGATWGSLLQSARTSPHLWWVSLPPGLAITLTVMALHLLGERLGRQHREK
ncbi:MAG: ABC transporter permease [Saprospiraceae bacterium]|nr:ABC transporter permease [Saprospiraceae bacterium]MDW8484705.1 ABC transporter permease [Saprospiraceae bacterium]